jgi:acyl-CoA dehydrogenase
MRRIADAAGHYRFALPSEYGGKDGSHLAMACIREHLAAKGLGLHNDLQNESSIVGNLVQPLMVRDFGTETQKAEYIPAMLEGRMRWTFGLTEEHHGSDATWMDTRAVRETRDGVDGWLINGNKMWTTAIRARMVMRAVSAVFWCRRIVQALRLANICGPSTCRPITRRYR